jgi:hypothetical protein
MNGITNFGRAANPVAIINVATDVCLYRTTCRPFDLDSIAVNGSCVRPSPHIDCTNALMAITGKTAPNRSDLTCCGTITDIPQGMHAIRSRAGIAANPNRAGSQTTRHRRRRDRCCLSASPTATVSPREQRPNCIRRPERFGRRQRKPP